MSQASSLSSPLLPIPLESFKSCQICRHLEEEKYDLEMQCQAEKKLSAFDPFAGAGGFGLGLAQGCSMRTVLGVDIDPSATETMRSAITIQFQICFDPYSCHEGKTSHQILQFLRRMPTNSYEILSRAVSAG